MPKIIEVESLRLKPSDENALISNMEERLDFLKQEITKGEPPANTRHKVCRLVSMVFATEHGVVVVFHSFAPCALRTLISFRLLPVTLSGSKDSCCTGQAEKKIAVVFTSVIAHALGFRIRSPCSLSDADGHHCGPIMSVLVLKRWYPVPWIWEPSMLPSLNFALQGTFCKGKLMHFQQRCL